MVFHFSHSCWSKYSSYWILLQQNYKMPKQFSPYTLYLLHVLDKMAHHQPGSPKNSDACSPYNISPEKHKKFLLIYPPDKKRATLCQLGTRDTPPPSTNNYSLSTSLWCTPHAFQLALSLLKIFIHSTIQKLLCQEASSTNFRLK